MPKKAFFIAALAASATGGFVAKSELVEFFWPAAPASQRANNLRQLLFRVRQFELQHGWALFESNDDAVGLAPGVICDLLEFDRATRAETSPSSDQLFDAYGGVLLDGYDADGQALRQWLSNHRLQLEDNFLELLLSTTDHVSPDDRKTALHRAITLAPNAISPRKALMRQLLADGLTQEAKHQHRAIQNMGGHGVAAATPELILTVPGRASPPPAIPLAQIGRDRAGVPHLALLPPKAVPGSGHELLLAEGLIDDVTVALTRLRSISVLAAYSARRIVAADDARGIGVSRADFVLKTKLSAAGSRHRGGMPRLNLVLERAASGDIIWADGISLDAEAGPMQFAAIANSVALTLVDQIERATLRSFHVPADAGAYGHYLLGQRGLHVLDLPSTRRARASFKAALVTSPHFAPAHTGIAQSMIYEWVMRGGGNPELIVRARAAAERARDIDPLFGGAHQMLGRASLFDGDFAASLAHFEQAEALNPHHADLLCDFADTLMHSSLAQDANSKIELALRLNPLAPDTYWWAAAGIKFFVGEYEGALKHLANVKSSEPVLRLIAACAAMAGQPELAKQARNRFLAIDPGFKLDDWISVLPVRDPAHRRQYRNALQKAGFT